MQLHVIPVDDIVIPQNRQRKFFDEAKIQELAASIAQNGLIQPVVVRNDEVNNVYVLVAGERRMRALDILWGYGEAVICNNYEMPDKTVPCVYLGDIDEVDAFEIELEENIRRTDLDWKEKAQAVSQLFELRRMQSERDGTAAPTVTTIAEEVTGSGEGQFRENIREDLILARNLDNPVVAKAGSRKEAFKALKRDEEVKRNAELGRKIGETFTSDMHTLLQGDCLQAMSNMPEGLFDVILTDPPYGMGADSFGDSDGKATGGHSYDDSEEEWFRLLRRCAGEFYRLAKPQAHAYVFCDIEKFVRLRVMMNAAGWTCFRTPLIWVNPTAMRAPWPERGPQRKWQMILYAVKGDKNVTRLYPDVLSYPSDPNLGHQAQKPVSLYRDLLTRSIRPGDSVFDPFAGTGTIFAAAHVLMCRATGIERDPGFIGISSKRLEELE